MKAIFYFSTEIGENDILFGLLDNNIETETSKVCVDLDLLKDEQVSAICSEIDGYDFAITRSFSVNVAEACHLKSIPYIAWCYDSPVRALYTKQALYDTNFVFVFDRQHKKRLEETGLKNIYYQPLAANMFKAASAVITDEDLIKNKRDVSFVGSIYSKGFYDAVIRESGDECREECEKMFGDMLLSWNAGDYIFDRISDKTIGKMYSCLSKEDRELYSMSDRYLTETLILVYELTSRERITMLNECAKRYNTVINTYNPGQYAGLINAKILPPVKDQSNELYSIYAASSINLNLTMRSIESGVPQRVFDIMSVGGPVFSNYQEEAAELFDDGKEIVLFHSFEEFEEKADYYLRHENETLNLGARGYLKVKDKYNYTVAIKNMVSRVFPGAL